MNTAELYDWYYKLLEYGFSFHPKFFDELISIINKCGKGNEKEIFKLLHKQFEYVKQFGNQVDKANGNEILRHTNCQRELYSLHIQNKTVNIRLIVAFDDDGDPNFLYAFNEKKGSKGSYQNQLPIAEKRCQEFVEKG